VRLLNQLAWVLPILAHLLYGAAIAIAPRRRKAVLRTGIGIAVSMAAAVLGYNLMRTVYLDGLPSTVQSPAAAAAVFDTLTRFLQRGLRILLLVGLVTAAIATLAGPSRGAIAIRGNWTRIFSKAGAVIEGEPGPVRAWFACNLKGLRIAILVIVLLVLVIWPRPTGVVFLWTAAFALAALAIVQFVGAGGQLAAADADVVPSERND
jgi:hypothetical protein